jgi:hypothetical protein
MPVIAPVVVEKLKPATSAGEIAKEVGLLEQDEGVLDTEVPAVVA